MKLRQSLFCVLLFGLSLVSTYAQEIRIFDKPRQPLKLRPGEMPKTLREKLTVSDAEKTEYKEITKNSKGKLAKIWNYLCEYEEVIDANDAFCLSQLELAGGSGYLFNQRPSQKAAANINVIRGQFRALSYSQFKQMVVDVGEMDLGLISEKTPEVEALYSLPVYGDKNAYDLKNLPEGIVYKKLKITDKEKIILNHTYLLRTLDVRPLTVEAFTSYWRAESLHAFQVVKFENNIVIIVWKEIDSRTKLIKLIQ